MGNSAPVDRRGLVWQMAGGYLSAICYGSPHEVAFGTLVEWVRSTGTNVSGLLVEDLRGWLDAARVDRLRRLSLELGVPVVLLSDSPFARGAAVAARWLGQDVHAFGRSGLESALQQLGVPKEVRPQVRSAVQALRVARALGSSRRRRRSDGSSQTPVPVA